MKVWRDLKLWHICNGTYIVFPQRSWKKTLGSMMLLGRFPSIRLRASCICANISSVCFEKFRISAVKVDHSWTRSETFFRKECRVSIPDVIMNSNLVMLDNKDEFCWVTTNNCWDVSWVVSWMVEDWSRISSSLGPISWTSAWYVCNVCSWLLVESALRWRPSKLREQLSKCWVCLSIASRICLESWSVELWCAVTLSVVWTIKSMLIAAIWPPSATWRSLTSSLYISCHCILLVNLPTLLKWEFHIPRHGSNFSIFCKNLSSGIWQLKAAARIDSRWVNSRDSDFKLWRRDRALERIPRSRSSCWYSLMLLHSLLALGRPSQSALPQRWSRWYQSRKAQACQISRHCSFKVIHRIARNTAL